MSERIKTLHPKGKQGVSISKEKYETVREAILRILRDRGEISFQELTPAVENHIGGHFDGSVPWYTVTIKLDLEARGIIERLPGTSPQVLRMGGK
jgi:hypothetical protein